MFVSVPEVFVVVVDSGANKGKFSCQSVGKTRPNKGLKSARMEPSQLNISEYACEYESVLNNKNGAFLPLKKCAPSINC